MRRTAHVRRAGAVVALATAALLPSPVSAATDAVPAPKNVIVLIGDGLGYAAVDLASAYQYGTTYHQVTVDPATGAVAHASGTASQVYQSFPVQVGQSTYSLSGRGAYDDAAAWQDFAWVASGATDSAAAGTALATGTKTTNGRVGVAPDGTLLENLTQRADALGKATGLVTSVPFSHATPAAFAGHNANRSDYFGITHEYLQADYLDVVIGAGHPLYDDTHRQQTTPNYRYVSAPDWQRLVDGATGFTLVEETADFEALAAGTLTPERVFGAVQVGSTLQQGRTGASTATEPFTVPRNDVPDLPTLARGALNVLAGDADGFFLMVEGGAIDWAGHANTSAAAVEETVDFNRTVEAVVAWVEAKSSWAETLVVVTADHETGYLTGPGADPTWTTLSALQGSVAAHDWHSSGHTNQLVPLWAKGPGAAALAARATDLDPVRGAYLDNADVGGVLLDELWPRQIPMDAPIIWCFLDVPRSPDSPVIEDQATQLAEVGTAGRANPQRATDIGLTTPRTTGSFLVWSEGNANRGSANARWVRQLYRHVLAREATGAEVQGWVGVLTAGHSRDAVAAGLLLSTGRLRTVAHGAYVVYLVRSIDPSGVLTWVTAIQRGSWTERIIAGIEAGNEYLALAQRG